MSWFSDFVSTIEADVEGIFKAEVAALAPVAQQAVTSLAAGELADLTTPGGTKNTGKTLASVVSATVTAAEAAGIQAAAPSIVAAIGKALPPVASASAA